MKHKINYWKKKRKSNFLRDYWELDCINKHQYDENDNGDGYIHNDDYLIINSIMKKIMMVMMIVMITITMIIISTVKTTPNYN